MSRNPITRCALLRAFGFPLATTTAERIMAKVIRVGVQVLAAMLFAGGLKGQDAEQSLRDIRDELHQLHASRSFSESQSLRGMNEMRGMMD